MDRHPAPQIGEPEGRSAVAAINRAEQAEEGVVLAYGQELPVAKRPAANGEIASEHDDLAYERF